jgi:glycosyltransferase involved in cell wall biosynthesis
MRGTLGQLLFIQRRSVRAGAQTSLARLLASEPVLALRPAVLYGEDGWLFDLLAERKIPTARVRFPSSRAILTRMRGLGGFAREAVGELERSGIRPAVIVANDHQECPLALALAKRLGNIPVVGLLRSFGLSERDFRKYRCDECASLMPVGETLQQRMAPWTSKTTVMFQEGFAEAEFHAPVEVSKAFPARWLVLGSEAPGKGFEDFIEALDILACGFPDFPSLQCDFTGSAPPLPGLLARPRPHHLNFLGRVENIIAVIKDHAIVIHPSRGETFGIAPLEAMLAGVPALASQTGIIPRLGLPQAWVFPPRDPRAIAERMVDLWKNWPPPANHIPRVQQTIRESFHIDKTSRLLVGELAKLGIETP